MKQEFSRLYILIMRAQGACVLSFAAMFWLGLSSSANVWYLMIVPVAVATFVTGLALSFAIPSLTPTFLKLPQTRMDVLTVGVVLLVSGVLFVITIMGGIALYGISEPFATSLAVGASGVSILATLALIALAMTTLVVQGPAPQTEPAPEDFTEILRTLPPLEDIRSRPRSAA